MNLCRTNGTVSFERIQKNWVLRGKMGYFMGLCLEIGEMDQYPKNERKNPNQKLNFFRKMMPKSKHPDEFDSRRLKIERFSMP